MEQFPISLDRRRGEASSVFINILLVLLVVIILLELTFFTRFKKFYVSGDSMYPTLVGAEYKTDASGNRINSPGGDYVYGDTSANVERFDIVVIEQPSYPIIKRVIAFGGETVELIKGELYIDGERIDEPYVLPECNDPSNNYNTYGPEIVPEGCIFVLGDNRNASIDSRDHYGMIDIGDVVGVVEQWSLDLRWLITPFNTFFDFTLPSIFSGCKNQ